MHRKRRYATEVSSHRLHVGTLPIHRYRQCRIERVMRACVCVCVCVVKVVVGGQEGLEVGHARVKNITCTFIEYNIKKRGRPAVESYP